MTKQSILKELKQRQGSRSTRAYAAELGCSTTYLADIYGGTREIGPKVLAKLGIEKQTTKKTIYRWR